MSHDRNPDAEYIKRFAERMRERWTQQDKLDETYLALDAMKNRIEVATNKDDPKPSPLRSGLVGLLNDEDAALLTITPFTHINPPSDDEDDISHASEVLEPWLAGGMQKSQKVGPAWDRKPPAMRRLGRAWSRVLPDPEVWSGEQFKKAVDEDDTKLLKQLKRDNWPIIWTYVDPRKTWTYFGGRHWLPEVIEIRKMTKEEIEDTWPGKLPAEHAKSAGSTEIEVFVYANWVWTKTVIAGKVPEIAHEFKHDLGMNPYILMEDQLMPDNDMGLRWKPALFHAKDLVETFDELLSDLRTNHHENTRTPVLTFFDKEEYDEDIRVSGRPVAIDMRPGGSYAFWNTEDVRLGPVAQINQQSIFLLQFVYQLIRENAVRPVERGETKSGASNNLFTTQVQIAEREFDPAMRAIRKAWETASVLHMRCVTRLNAEFPKRPDKVYVYDPRKDQRRGFIGVGPDDVIGWEAGVQARAQRAIPIDRNVNAALAQRLLQIGIDPWTVFEQELGYENADQIMRLANRFRAKQSVFDQVVVPLMLQRTVAVQQQLSAQEQARFNELFTGASPELQQLLVESGAVPTVEAPGNLQQATANLNRAGTPQEPQQAQQQVIP